MAKRGRKPKEKQPSGYFYEKQEQAVLDYLNSTDPEEKNRIYNEILRPAFEKMVESIIRRYKLYVPNEPFEDTYHDALSFILMKCRLPSLDSFISPINLFDVNKYISSIKSSSINFTRPL